MARALIVGCGCRGRELGKELLEAGWAVRGTSRREAGLGAIEAAGIEPAIADPDRVGTLLELVGDVAVVLHALGSATGDPEAVAALHGPRLRSLMEGLVDTPVRGFVYAGAGSVEGDVLAGGAEIVGAAGRTWRIPVEVCATAPADPAWVVEMSNLALGLLSPAGANKNFKL